MTAPTAVGAPSPVQDRSQVETGAPTAPLSILHEGISTPTCERAPKTLRLKGRNRHGTHYVKPRCHATNLCDYCAKLAAVETSETLALDALNGYAPTLWLVLTTRSTSPRPADFYRAREKLWRAVKRRWPAAEYAALVEFTTGYGTGSGGRRRPHWNVLVKNVPASAIGELQEVVRRVWCARVDADPRGQFVGEVAEAGGLLRYIALHFLKESQRPPKGWRGHRFVSSRGYFPEGASTARAVARRALQRKRAWYKAARALGSPLHPAVEMGAEYLLAVEDETEWELVNAAVSPLRPFLVLEREGGSGDTLQVLRDADSTDASIQSANERNRNVDIRTVGLRR